MQHQEVGAARFVHHKRHKPRYKDEVAYAVQCNTRRLLLEYINKLGRAPDTELLNTTVSYTCHYSCDAGANDNY
jgi:hypothetical protein